MEMGEERKENIYGNEKGSWWLVTDHKKVKNETMTVLIVTQPELNVLRSQYTEWGLHSWTEEAGVTGSAASPPKTHVGILILCP